MTHMNYSSSIQNCKSFCVRVFRWFHQRMTLSACHKNRTKRHCMWNGNKIPPSISITIFSTNKQFTHVYLWSYLVSEESESSEKEWLIAVSALSSITVGLCLAYCIFLYVRRRGLKSRREAELTEQAENTTYQELDVTRMNAAENYQSLNISEPEQSGSTYQALDLSKMNTVEENYQSLIANEEQPGTSGMSGKM